MKVLDGYYSNVRNYVSIQDKKLYVMKSHDCHAMMQQLLLLLIVIKNLSPKDIRVLLKICVSSSMLFVRRQLTQQS